MKTKLKLYHFLCQTTPISNANEPTSHLINSLEEIKDIYRNYSFESKQLFYLCKNNIHKILYDNDYIFNFNSKDLQKVLPENSDKIKVSELFYLTLLIIDQPEMINYSFDIDYILQINNKLFNSPINNSIQDVIVSKIIVFLINYYLEQSEEGSENIQQLESIREDNFESVKSIIKKNKIFKKLNYTFDDIFNKNIEQIYVDIITFLIKTNQFFDFDYIYEIIEDLNLKSISLTQVMYEGILRALDENNEYLNNYKIEYFNDLKEEKINFYYVLIRFILKNTFYLYNIPFLRKNYLKIISFRDFFTLNPDYNLFSKMQYLFQLQFRYNINTNSDDNSIKTIRSNNFEKAFINWGKYSNESSYSNFSDRDTEKNNKINDINDANLKCAQQILKNVTITLMPEKNNMNGISYNIKQIKVNNNTLKVRFFTYLLNGIDNTDNITYKNYSRLLNFIEEVKEYISQNELYYTPEIKLEFKRDFDWEQEYNFLNQIRKDKDKDIYYLTCTSSFIANEKVGNNEEYEFKDYNVLVNGLDEEPNGFLYLINELTNEDYQFNKED